MIIGGIAWATAGFAAAAVMAGCAVGHSPGAAQGARANPAVATVARVDAAAVGFCAAEIIAKDLGIIGEFDAAWAEVTECDGHWALIAWDQVGDTRRVIRRDPIDGWKTYAYTAHSICWTSAVTDGVAPRLQRYFLGC
ncbi:hypothetical protein D5S18_15045 [Nocardia panacis]|uniref:DUF3558 domain-containing protein n=1 Tax=Nocardia panacis TaxID=2340916 RepID=A0A3A4KZ14_9NOCA|nr:hypothetical protein [Nocardia panacis]RJO74767.1 hypothetical protein D5S18_15045 [Nocardia panacis]